LLSNFDQEKTLLVSLAKKYKAEEEQAKKDNTPECKKCKLRRKQATAFPASCEG